MDRGLLSIHLSLYLSETNVEACENDVFKKKEERNQQLKSNANPVNKSPAHTDPTAFTMPGHVEPRGLLSPSVCFHGKRLHSQGGLVGPLKGY